MKVEFNEREVIQPRADASGKDTVIFGFDAKEWYYEHLNKVVFRVKKWGILTIEIKGKHLKRFLEVFFRISL